MSVVVVEVSRRWLRGSRRLGRLVKVNPFSSNIYNHVLVDMEDTELMWRKLEEKVVDSTLSSKPEINAIG